MSTFQNAQRKGFVKGGGSVYTCRVCKRKTRPTGTGDNDDVRLCVDCFDLAGEENHFADHGKLYDKPENVLAMIASIEAKGGDASDWAELKAEAQKRIAAPAPTPVQAQPAEVRTIDATPTWAGLMPLLVQAAANGTTTEARNAAMGELMRLATIVDSMKE